LYNPQQEVVMGRIWNGWWIGKVLWLGIVGAGLWLLASWLQMPLAPGLDTVIGLATLLWLFFIVTVPWNMVFQAHQLLFEAKVSAARGIRIDPGALAYARRWSRIALGIAIGLHVLTAIAFCGVALSGIGFIGWFGAIAATLLTLLRPGARAYVHVRDRLSRLGREIEVPREDAVELRRRLQQVEEQLTALTQKHHGLAAVFQTGLIRVLFTATRTFAIDRTTACTTQTFRIGRHTARQLGLAIGQIDI
jgi:hypothetical protein